jgi:hypothetical protein
VIQIFPPPIVSVQACSAMASASPSSTTMSSRTFGSSPVVAAWPASRPYCRPKPRTSVTVSPGTRLAISTGTSSSSVSALMMAVINFMAVSPSAESWRVGNVPVAGRSSEHQKI